MLSHTDHHGQSAGYSFQTEPGYISRVNACTWPGFALVTTRRTCFCVLSTCKNEGKRMASVRGEYHLRTESYGFGNTQTRRRTLSACKTFSTCGLRIHHPCVRVRANRVPRTYGKRKHGVPKVTNCLSLLCWGHVPSLHISQPAPGQEKHVCATCESRGEGGMRSSGVKRNVSHADDVTVKRHGPTSEVAYTRLHRLLENRRNLKRLEEAISGTSWWLTCRKWTNMSVAMPEGGWQITMKRGDKERI
ncbi:hypothetical protein Bbelb_041480 [Branchiostoma belcheri]|nr:hypothetical protein Bbelb_041480 [Branchiostoma belcheri]